MRVGRSVRLLFSSHPPQLTEREYRDAVGDASGNPLEAARRVVTAQAQKAWRMARGNNPNAQSPECMGDKAPRLRGVTAQQMWDGYIKNGIWQIVPGEAAPRAEPLDVCPRCGQVGTMKHGDPRDCRSPECMGEKADDADYLLGDR